MDFKKIYFLPFDSLENPLRKLSATPQIEYVIKYLEGLGVTSVVIETDYFDRDYLDEYSSFYARSAQGYGNKCSRMHFFRAVEVDEAVIKKATDDSSVLQDNYLGFLVIRPIHVAPLGRTVLRLYPDKGDAARFTTPARKYLVNVLGIELSVVGLAWQQQDSGVAACATICLWSMFHSSSYDDHHAIPTTASITKSATTFGKRPFPSTGLTIQQITEAIHQQNLNSVLVEADTISASHKYRAFSRARFSSNVAGFIRSGYPIMIAGFDEGCPDQGHAVCAVGFREGVAVETDICLSDSGAEYVYIHDDNYGPNLRFKVEEENGCCILRSAPPGGELTNPVFIPQTIVAAVHEEVKITVDEIFKKSSRVIGVINGLINDIYKVNGADVPRKEYGCRYITVREYMGRELAEILMGDQLFDTRKELYERTSPLSLHLGVARLGGRDSLFVDLLYDTTDSGRNMRCFGALVFDEVLYKLLNIPEVRETFKSLGLPGVLIPAFKAID